MDKTEPPQEAGRARNREAAGPHAYVTSVPVPGGEEEDRGPLQVEGWGLATGLPGLACRQPPPPPRPWREWQQAAPAHRLIRADGVHLGPEHDGREDEEEQALEAEQDEEDHRGGRREGAAL